MAEPLEIVRRLEADVRTTGERGSGTCALAALSASSPSRGAGSRVASATSAGGEAVATVTELLERVPIEVAVCDEIVAAAAAALRASHRSLSLPDALVIATASILDADRLVTTDRDWPSARKLGLRAAIATL